jgi:TPR repeat protein
MHLTRTLIISTLLFLVACSGSASQANKDLTTGYDYLKGTGGMTQDSAKAVELFTKAAKQGNRDAQYNTGLAYVRGEGVKKDYSEAYGWFELAAYQDDTGAQYNLGVMAINGEGTTVDPLAAYVWFKLADEKGYGGAKEGMESAKALMTEDQAKEIDRAYTEIFNKIRKPAEQPGSNDSAPL